jgi:hypothetical protein
MKLVSAWAIQAEGASGFCIAPASSIWLRCIAEKTLSALAEMRPGSLIQI